MSSWRLVNRKTGEAIVEELELADGYWSRMAGLQFRASFPRGCALLLVPAASIHTMWVRFAIDVVMLDRQGSVLEVHERVRPWRIVKAPRGTHAVLEFPGGASPLTTGDQVQLAGSRQAISCPPKSLRFLLC